MHFSHTNKNVVLDLIHYSKIEYVIMSSLMTATTSIVLNNRINWQSVIIVACGTYFIYTVDNILDWSGEYHLLGNIQKIWKYYLDSSIVLLFASLFIIFSLVIKKHETMITLIILGIFAFFQVLFTKQEVYQFRSTFFLWVERLADAVVWSLVTVLVHLTYLGSVMRPQVIMVIGFNFLLSLNIVMISDVTRAPTNGYIHPTPVLSDVYGETYILDMLKVFCISSIFLAIIDIVLGFFPVYNLIVLSAPCLYLILILFRRRFYDYPVFYNSLFSMASIISCIAIILVYTFFY